MREVWYPKNRSKHIDYVKNLKKKLAVFIEDYKKNRACIDCGYKGDKCPQVLEFDHLRDKKFEISLHKRYISSLSQLKEEIKKCELVCANCHRIRTFKKQNSKKPV